MNDPYQKAAKLLIALDPSAARKLLLTLNEDERENINNWIDQIETISTEEANQLIESFYFFYVENSFDTPKNNHLIEKIENGDLLLIERMIRKESPHTIAMFLPFLSLKTTSKLLSQMDEQLLGSIVSEAAQLEPEQLENAKTTLEKNWGKLSFFQPTYGVDLVKGWYLSLDERKKIELLEILHHIDPALESQLALLNLETMPSNFVGGNIRGSY